MALTLAELCVDLRPVAPVPAGGPAVATVAADSRETGPGAVFVAVRGTRADGHLHVADAVARGCLAVIVQAGWTTPAELTGPAGPVPVVVVPDTRPVPALLARRLEGLPDRSLVTAGVTGTNGKTTVSYLLRSVLERLHGPCGLLGTVRYLAGEQSQPAPLTTPAGPVFYRWLGRMTRAGCRSAAMEISSHALDQSRTAGLELDVAVLTNLTRDHLDYHATVEDYLAAKAKILDHLRPAGSGPLGRRGTVVINADDPLLAGLDARDHPVVRFSAGRAAKGPPADLAVTAAELSLQGTHLSLEWRGRRLSLVSPLVGRYNVENLTAALAAGLALGFEPEAVVAGLQDAAQVPGRMERFDLPGGGLAVVDYAHTPDALAAVLAACDELSPGRVLAVFGCGGDRDRGKRPLMGRAAVMGADAVWITTDNPRGEDPAAISAEILAGCEAAAAPRAAGWVTAPDRTAAVGAALAAAGPGDVVVIAGKGHEDYQLVGDRVLELDDRRIVADWIAQERADG